MHIKFHVNKKLTNLIKRLRNEQKDILEQVTECHPMSESELGIPRECIEVATNQMYKPFYGFSVDFSWLSEQPENSFEVFDDLNFLLSDGVPIKDFKEIKRAYITDKQNEKLIVTSVVYYFKRQKY